MQAQIWKLNISLWFTCKVSDTIRIDKKVCFASLFEFGSEDPIIHDNAHILLKQFQNPWLLNSVREEFHLAPLMFSSLSRNED